MISADFKTTEPSLADVKIAINSSCLKPLLSPYRDMMLSNVLTAMLGLILNPFRLG